MTNLIRHCQLISFIDLHTCNFTPELGEKSIVEETEIRAPSAAEAKTTILHFQSGAWTVYKKYTISGKEHDSFANRSPHSHVKFLAF